ncbi:uncharacterized protein LOC7465611 [Populus trichocarpa]|uniref:uncharacterized protein LOC7465611 n=1 Tax=Populus trichocarpa TaxID=3694 RepID=UPI002277E00B|nr:uncharacterized protein LOC7465611 [Populus trichocarpa]
MGEIKEGKVSGLIPRNEGFAVHYPGYPSSTSRAIQTLGGTESILKARSSQSNTLELYFRPEDPYSHPVSGELRSCHSMLLKITKKKKSSPINDAKQETDEFHADIVARIPEAYYFEGMADYEHVVPVHADVGRKRWKNCKKPGLMDLGPDDVMMLPPPLFSLKDVPENIVLRPPSTSSSRKKQDELPETHPKMTFEPALGIDFKDVEEIPKEINWKEFITEGTPMWEWQMVVSKLFEEQPIWPKYSLIERLLDKNLKFTYQTLKRLLLTVGYYFSGGPFQKFWIRKGYDPRKDPDSRRYQSIGFRVPPELKSYCDANTAKGTMALRMMDDTTPLPREYYKLVQKSSIDIKSLSTTRPTSFLYQGLWIGNDRCCYLKLMICQLTCLKHRWEDLCKFRFFPYRNQYSFQVYELDDDYIQQEIQKPSKQTSCIVRFLSLYPETGAEKFLKAASEKFMKSKRLCIYKDAPKPVQEEHQQTNEDHETFKNNEASENQVDVEVDELESDDGEEELDTWNGFGW